MRAYRTYLKLFMLLFTGFFGGAILLSLYLDPFQVYHESYLNKDRFVQDQDRFQNAGLINLLWNKKECCKAILLGTSHSQNFDGYKMGEVLGVGPILNLSMSGATPHEEKILIDYLMESGRKPAYIFWELHTPFTVSPLEVRDQKKLTQGKILPVYLYDTMVWNDAPYVLSFDAIRFGIKQVTSHFDLHEHKTWFSRNLSSFGKGQGIYKKNLPLYEKGMPVLNDDGSDFESIKDIILPIVRANPGIKFKFFFPPYSLHFYAAMGPNEFSNMMRFRNRLVFDLSSYENSEVFAFDLLGLGTDDLNQYKDVGHYHPDLGNKAIEAMAAGRGALRKNNVREHVSGFIKKINEYCLKAGTECHKPNAE